LADAIRLKEDLSLKHQANLGEDVEEIAFAAGTELEVLQEFETAWLCKDDDGQLFNIRKEQAEEV
jgi:hypothetical protein